MRGTVRDQDLGALRDRPPDLLEVTLVAHERPVVEAVRAWRPEDRPALDADDQLDRLVLEVRPRERPDELGVVLRDEVVVARDPDDLLALRERLEPRPENLQLAALVGEAVAR